MEEKNTNLIVKAYGASNIGKIRKENQDSFYLDGKYLHKFQGNDSFELVQSANVPQLYAVFDGLGGEEGGAESSKIACETMLEFQKRITEAPIDKMYSIFCDFATEANERICQELRSTFYPKGGTTFVALQISDGALHPFYLGDSRIYLSFDNKLYMLSEDHTVAAQEVKNGTMTEEEAIRSPKNHMLTHFLGDQPGAEKVYIATNTSIDLEDGMVALMCSDGLHDVVPAQVILNILIDSKNPAQDLVDAALKFGGYDNVTPVVLKFEKAE